MTDQKTKSPILNILAWIIVITVYLSVALILLQGILIPFTIGVSVIFMPIPLVILLVDYFLLKHVGFHPEFEKLSDSMQKRIRSCIDIMRVCRVVTKVAFMLTVIFIGIGAIVGMTFRYLKMGTVF